MKSSTEKLPTVAIGLGLVYAGLCLLVFSVFWIPISGLITQDLRTALLLGGVLLLLAVSLDIAGRILCLSVPRETGARAIVYVSVGLSVAALVLSLLHIFGLFAREPILSPLLMRLQTPLALAASILFAVFLYQLAVYVESPKMARQAIGVLVLGGVLLVVYAVALVLAGEQGLGQGPQVLVGQPRNESLILALGIVLLVGGLVLLVSYGNLLTYLRKDVLKYVQRDAVNDFQGSQDEDRKDWKPSDPDDRYRPGRG